MKFSFLAFIFLLSFQVSALTLEAQLQTIFSQPNPSCELAPEDFNQDLNCALELCGKPKNNPTARLVQFSLPPYMTKEAQRRFAEIEKKVESQTQISIQNQLSFVQATRAKIGLGKKIDFNQWSADDYLKIAPKIYDRFIESDHSKIKFHTPQNAEKEFLDGLKSYSEGSEPCNQLCQQGIRKYLSNFDFDILLNNIETVVKADSFPDEQKSFYQANIAYKLLSDSKLENLQGQFPSIAQEFVESLNYLSKDSQAKIKEHLNNHVKLASVDYQVPPLSYMTVETLDVYLAKIKKRPYPKAEDFSQTSTFELTQTLLSYRTEWDDSVAVGFTPKLLAQENFEPKSMNKDKSETKDIIHISTFTISNPEQGKRLIFHELGHLISHLVDVKVIGEESSRKYIEIRNCISKNHVGAESTKTTFEGHKLYTLEDTVYSEEDMADRLSFGATPNDQRFTFCSFMLPSSNGETYQHPKLLLAENNADPHSSDLYRLIMEAKYKKKSLPPSCLEAISKVDDKLKFNSCY